MSEVKTRGTKSYIDTANEFEKIERILLYFKVSNFCINQDMDLSVKKLKEFNGQLNVPYEFSQIKEREFIKIENYEHSLASMMYIRTLDNFINYFKEILSEVVKIQPKLLKSKDKETLEFILSYDSYEDLIHAITEKKVEALFYHGIADIKDYFKTRLGIEIFEDSFDNINLLIKQRNLAVHNRGKITKEFIKQFPNEKFIENLFLNFTFDYVEKILMVLYKIVSKIDDQISKKFNLNTISY